MPDKNNDYVYICIMNGAVITSKHWQNCVNYYCKNNILLDDQRILNCIRNGAMVTRKNWIDYRNFHTNMWTDRKKYNVIYSRMQQYTQ
jgi:hypothetical protein